MKKFLIVSFVLLILIISGCTQPDTDNINSDNGTNTQIDNGTDIGAETENEPETETELEQQIEQAPEQEATEETAEEASEESVAPEGTTGNLAIYLKDLPTDEIETLNITFSKLEAHKTGGEWFTISEEEQTFDLLQLQDVSTLFGENILETGHYTMLRLDIVKATLTLKEDTANLEAPNDNGNSGNGNNGNSGTEEDTTTEEIEETTPEEIEVTIPSNTLRFNHGFYVGEGETTELLIDFLVDKSLMQTGNGDWKLKPVIKLLTLKEPNQEENQEQNQEENQGEDQQNQEENQEENQEGLCGNSEIDENENCSTCPDDVICEEGFECSDGACTEINLCGNSEIDDGEDCSTCAEDVTCEEGYECTEGTCTEITLCGNGTVDTGEDCETCIEDVPCSEGLQCIGGSCVNMV
ncbi:MAG: DUF4382 domain-containing protein [Candidatus Diapherotrites archaeon]